jgi:hypothetical protein
MEYRLAGTFIAIENQSIAILIDALVSRDLFGPQRHPACHLDILIFKVIDGRDVLLGNNQHVRGRLWIDIPEGENMLVFEHLVTWYFTVSDLAKQAIGHARSPWSTLILMQLAPSGHTHLDQPLIIGS